MILRKILPREVSDLYGRMEKGRSDSIENLRQERQRNDTLLAPDGDSDVTNPEAQAGRWMMRSEFIERIRKLNSNVWYEQSIRYPAQGGIYIHDEYSPYRKRMVVGLPHDRIDEFSTVLTVPAIIPDASIAPHWHTIQKVDNKRPGWRAVLLKLLMEGILTSGQVEKEFKISEGRSSQFWQRSLN